MKPPPTPAPGNGRPVYRDGVDSPIILPALAFYFGVGLMLYVLLSLVGRGC